ncbi:T6SS immunity protein Tli3 family protein [Variovorax sp. GB1R11]|uniref:T6SS immunity protein Tli3 family protein n=1 Tax=Variovorax sp. GB1R11 TaxID=3443741 RepID=UPI003F4570D7
MSRDNDLSSLLPVVPEPGKYQWVKGKSTGIEGKQKDRTHIRRLRWLTSVALVLGLGACAQGGSPPKVWPAEPAKPPAPPVTPQVAYRIDEHRYFEITPEDNCYGDMLYFVDTAKGIRSEVVGFDAVMNRTTLIIDAANDQYLVAPVTRGGINCSSGGGGCAAATMPYSIDGGRTWKRVWSPGTTYDLMVSGSTAYQSHRNVDVITDGLDLTHPTPQSSDWTYLPGFVFKPRIPPADIKVQCKAQDSGSRK